MPQLERLQEERRFHDRQAAARAERFVRDRDDLRFEDDEYLDHETWIRPAIELLGDVSGRRILDLGSGHGMAAVVLARRGARVVGIDLSAGYVAEARARATANGISAEFQVGDAERLPFPDCYFDAVWGSAILHHLEVPVAARELARVLKPGGHVVLCEPWGDNPFVAWARRNLPYRGKHRTADERPLMPEDVAALRDIFPETRMQTYQLLGAVRRLWSVRRSRVWNAVDGLDRLLMRIFPPLRNWGRYAVLQIEKP